GTGARSVGQDDVEPRTQRFERGFIAGPENLHIAHTRTLYTLEDRFQLMAVGVVSIELPGVLHQGGEWQGFSAGTGAKVEDLLARPSAGEKRRDLRTLVLDLEPSGLKGRLSLQVRRALRAHRSWNPDTDWRSRTRQSAERCERLQNLLPCRL